jgi:hypothetical protein
MPDVIAGKTLLGDGKVTLIPEDFNRPAGQSFIFF